MLNSFLNTLFDPGDYTCFARTAKGTHVYPVFNTDFDGVQYFSINALDGHRDHAPQQAWHEAHKPRRANANVTKYRNILVEFDNLSLDMQLAHVATIGLPYSTCVYSGGKSYHFIISLEQPLDGGSLEYAALVERVYAVLPQSDRACRNPSRLSRFPGFLRDGTTEQTLKEVRGRIPYAELDAWLTKNGAPPVAIQEYKDPEPGDGEELFFVHGERWLNLQRFAGRFRAWGLGEEAIHACLMALYDYHCEHAPGDLDIDGDMANLAKWAASRPPDNTKPQPVAPVNITTPGKTTKVVMPSGKVFKVPNGQVGHFVDQGGKVTR